MICNIIFVLSGISRDKVLDIWYHCSSFLFLSISLCLCVSFRPFFPLCFDISIRLEIIPTHTFIFLHLFLPLFNGSTVALWLSPKIQPGVKQLLIFIEVAYKTVHKFSYFPNYGTMPGNRIFLHFVRFNPKLIFLKKGNFQISLIHISELLFFYSLYSCKMSNIIW